MAQKSHPEHRQETSHRKHPLLLAGYDNITDKRHSCLGLLLKMLTRLTHDVLNLLISATSNDNNSIVINQSALITANEPRVSL